jgi:hypothetical protein
MEGAVESTALDLVFVDFDEFQKMGRICRSPNELVLDDILHELKLYRLSDIDVNRSLLIFVSHRWIGGSRPDVNDSKFRLCCNGINLLKESMLASTEIRCYLWIDYSCIDQEGTPALELNHLKEIISVCDCVFTPVVDDNPGAWEFEHRRPDLYHDIRSPFWAHESAGYINRAWCRVEMLYAATIAVDESRKAAKLGLFKAGLLYHQREGRRPHFVYSNKEEARIWVLPPFQHSFFDRYDPTKGALTFPGDATIIVKLVEELRPYMRTIEPGYVGERADGLRHGRGKEQFKDGGVYEGEWFMDKIQGTGISRYANGNLYEGQWHQGKKHGLGKMRYSDGDVYEGSYVDGKRRGPGSLLKANGTLQCGIWEGFELINNEAL